jgi:hypothetical protein
MAQTILEDIKTSVEVRIQCDGCSARATMVVNMPYGELSFCSHHYNKHSDILTEQGGVARLLDILEKD